MTHQWDEFSKSLAEPLPRRESLRRLGSVLAGAALGPLAVGTAWARAKRPPPPPRDPCKDFCKCRNTKQQNACLAACKACKGDTRRLCGTCGSYVCCSDGWTCCGNTCRDLIDDPYNCGACGHICPQAGPFAYGACIRGQCESWCVEGAVVCDGACTVLSRDPDNCGACGNVCGDLTPYCSWGQCWDANCGGANLDWDANNCGRCGYACPPGFGCSFGVCGSPGGGDSGY